MLTIKHHKNIAVKSIRFAGSFNAVLHADRDRVL
jgi:hypothetical protein